AKWEGAEKKPSVIRGLAAITWTVSDIAKAGCLLGSPPLPATFEDEQEMRRVYTLIYDVFRYKTILNQALNDVSFFQMFPKLASSAPHVWLLFYDLYHRSFMKRETKVAPIAASLFDAAGIAYAENALWTQQVKLAAAVSRLRIKHNALSLSELLPAHLKDERVTEQAKNNPVTCWINPVTVRDTDRLCKSLEKHLGLKLIYETDRMHWNSYKWDRHCPDMMMFHSSLRARLARSRYVRDYLLIVQDRSFCLGPATFNRVIINLELTGDVIQTHVNSPRTTAYLATLLRRNDKIRKLMAFSAGKRKNEYENYFKELGLTNIEIFVDRLIDTPLDAPYMEEVVAVFATPPNSYSAVSDPIDLVCSRGGDLSMLEVLTETSDTKETRERITSILEEQKKTLKFAMSRPQVQFVLYETHSELEAENSTMVNKAIKEINKIAKLRHATIQGKMSTGKEEGHPENKEINNNDKSEKTEENKATPSFEPSSMQMCDENINCEEKLLENIEVPDTDVFDTPDLPTLCNCDICKHCEREGCYLALLKRKKVIRLDDKYMIQMAENRGLFGSTTSTGTAKSRSTSRGSKKKQDKSPEKYTRPKKKLKEEEIERIAAPTHTFLRHTKNTAEIEPCRKVELPEEEKPTMYRSWWRQTTRHILALKQSLVRQKLVPSTKIQNTDFKATGDIADSCPVDEMIAKNSSCSRIPIFPKLRLQRAHVYEKVQIPLHITSVEFPRPPNPWA
ncbi:hypothetical protein NQ318_017457, partial [Aromia moschata]